MSNELSEGIDNPSYDTYELQEQTVPNSTSDESNITILAQNHNTVHQILENPIKTMEDKREMSIIEEPMSMSWHSIDVFSKPSGGLTDCFKKKKNIKPVLHILKNVSGQVKSGQLLAIMGASGAGKTTLINVLTQRNLSNVEVKGLVKLNDKIANIHNITALSAYVQQDDLFICTLTVQEHLKFQSRVRMDQYLSEDLRNSRVEQMLEDLGLQKCANTVIGKPEDVRGISGGERKRLAFASELLTNPSIMFCDEPTSGLDSFMALSVVEVLRDMSSSGRTIVCTIHQPSSEVFSIFDQLLLMADGRVAYLGKSDKAVEYFSSLGLYCPVNYNPADFYIQQTAIIPGKEVQSKEKLNKICDRYIDSVYAKEAIPQQTGDQDIDSSKDPEIKSVYKSKWFTQFCALLWRSWISVLREPMVTRIRVIQTVFIAILLGFIYWRLDMDQTGIMDINGALFLLITNLNFVNAFGVINTFCVELPVFLREHNNGMYRVSAYFLAKMLAELPIFVIIPALFVSIFYYMVGLNSGFIQFIVCTMICILIANSACSFGYFVSCISSNVTIALSIGPPVMVPMLIFGGFFLNNKSVPVYFVWMKYISWFYYGNEALVINQWQNIDHIDCPSLNTTIESTNQTINHSINYCIPNGKEVIKKLNFSEDNLYRNIIALLALTLVLRSMAYLALLIRSRRR